VIAAAALLSAFPLPPARQVEAAEEAPPSPAEASPIPAGAALTLSSHAGSVLLGLTVEPARPGTNELTVYVQSVDAPRGDGRAPGPRVR